MKLAAVQHDIVWEDPPATMRLVAPMVDQAVAAGARLVVLAEMWSTGFSMAAERIAEAPEGPSASFLHEQAQRHGIWICGSIPTSDPALPRPVNRLLLVGPDGATYHYDKRHPFTFAGEDEHYAAGDGFCTVDIEGVRCSLFVCYDLRFGDDWWQRAGDTDCYVVVANWPEARRAHWEALVTARAIENQAYVVAVNRVGVDGNGLAYAGDSSVVNPLGEALVTATRHPTVLLADVDADHVAEVRARLPFLQDRRTFAVRPARPG